MYGIAAGCRRLLPINPLGPPGRSTSLGAHQPSPVAQCCMATMPHALLASHQLVKPAGSAATLYCLGLSTPAGTALHALHGSSPTSLQGWYLGHTIHLIHPLIWIGWTLLQPAGTGTV